MAGIDKIYGTQEQLLEFRAWLRENKPEYLEMVAEEDCEWYEKGEIRVISNFPEYVDRWLYIYCPIEFIITRLHEQYGGDPNMRGGG